MIEAARSNSTELKILASRFLTRSGDQAWDFALPLTLVSILRNRIDIVATIYLFSKLGSVILQPWVARTIDRAPRLRTAFLGVSLQVVSLLVVCGTVFLLRHALENSVPFSATAILCFAIIAIGSIVTSLGSGLMDIAVGNDWVPTIIDESKLTAFNSRLRQLDLATEVTAPVAAGALLLLSPPNFQLAGFLIIAVWNVISFVPELLLLRSVFRGAPQLQKSVVHQSEIAKQGILAKLFDGWGEFRKQRAMPVMVAYAFLWLSALSPHGVLLTAFLKGGWNLPESSLGLFRGLGAVFGLFSTLLFPVVTRKLGLVRSTGAFIFYQALMVVLALVFFLNPVANGMVFLTFILLSRIGLYGFSLGEMEIRQRMIPEGVRGVVNGAAASLTGLATVVLFALGSYFSTPDRFPVLIVISVAAVIIGAIVYASWTFKQGNRELTK